MFLSRNDGIPPDIEYAKNKVTVTKEHDGYYLMYQLIMRNHPIFLDNGRLNQ